MRESFLKPVDAQAPTFGSRSVTTIGIATVIAASVIGSLLMRWTTYDIWGAAVLAPPLIAAAIPALRRQAVRDRDSTIFWLLLAALLIKIVGGIARYYFDLKVYGGLADSSGYHRAGVRIATDFRSGIFDVEAGLSGTDFIKWLTGLIYSFTGSTNLGGFTVFSYLGFWGLFMFYRAFRIAIPDGNARLYLITLFFLPSLVMYSSGTGKDPWMVLSIGMAAYGVARLVTGWPIRGAPWIVVGVIMAGLVRPHVAGMFGMALLIGYAVGRPHSRSGRSMPLAKLATIIVLLFGASILVQNAQDFLERAGIDAKSGFGSGLGLTAERTGFGGSEFEPAILDSPSKALVATATVLYRPSLLEARNGQAVVAALEGAVLLIFTITRLGSLGSSLTRVRRNPYIAVCFAFVAMMIIALSSLANFGLLVRQRTTLIPLFLALLASRPRKRVSRAPIADRARIDVAPELVAP